MAPLVLSLAVIVAAPAVKDPPKKDAPVLVGVWLIDSGIKGGKPSQDPPGATMQFTADGKMILKEQGKEKPASYKIDAKKSPAEVDLDLPFGGKGSSFVGIYKVEGDTLTICLAFEGDRPTKFESPEGSKTILLTLKRAKKE